MDWTVCCTVDLKFSKPNGNGNGNATVNSYLVEEALNSVVMHNCIHMYNVVNPNGFNCQSRSAIFAFTCYKLLAQLYVANFVCVRVRVCECVFDKPITELCVVQCINTSIPHIQTYLYKYLLYYL